CKSKMKKITIVAYAICFLSGLWFLFSSVKDDFGILSFILGIALIYQFPSKKTSASISGR
ncbi:hypothetical protein D3583_09185, partial [Campylobacter jejuni]|nr:hypothetical protein [Campylobacter coli]EAM0788252.1 hypothetical protein [Campylobacter jejuni]